MLWLAPVSRASRRSKSAATKEQVLLTVDNTFYTTLQDLAVLKVAEQTVAP